MRRHGAEELRRPDREALTRRSVRVPSDVPGTAALFLVLRRMRAPLVVVISILSVSVLALTLAPGVDENGNPRHLTAFEAFYVMTYTATTIGFGEIPYAFSPEQRLVTTAAIYLSVVSWAYSIGTLLTLVQDPGFRRALATQRFRRGVHGIREPFMLVAGYGFTGRAVARMLDYRGERLVVVDKQQSSLDVLAADQLHHDAPGIVGDASTAATLGLAGLDLPNCEVVLALTDDEQANLGIVMAANLLRPGLPVIAYCKTAAVEKAMTDFGDAVVLNPYDAAGDYLVVAMFRPSAFRLATWLLAPAGSPLPKLPEGLGTGRWVIMGTGVFAREVWHDLEQGGMSAEMVKGKELPELDGVEGLVLATGSDIDNLALAAAARRSYPDVYLVMRQHGPAAAPLVRAFDPDMVFDPKEILVREVLARLVTPAFWRFVQHILTQDEAWARGVLDELRFGCGDESPDKSRLVIDPDEAPAVVRALQVERVRLADILRDPSDRDRMLPIVPLVLVRGHSYTYLPDLVTELHVGDEIVLAGRAEGLAQQYEVLYDDSTLHYAVTGQDVPTTLFWRVLTRRTMVLDRGHRRWRRARGPIGAPEAERAGGDRTKSAPMTDKLPVRVPQNGDAAPGATAAGTDPSEIDLTVLAQVGGESEAGGEDANPAYAHRLGSAGIEPGADTADAVAPDEPAPYEPAEDQDSGSERSDRGSD